MSGKAAAVLITLRGHGPVWRAVSVTLAHGEPDLAPEAHPAKHGGPGAPGGQCLGCAVDRLPRQSMGYAKSVEPIPETELALTLLDIDDEGLAEDMRLAASALQTAAPGTMAFSLAVLAEDVTLTYVSSAPSAALLDALQYLDGGPCEQALSAGTALEFGEDNPLDEQSWLLFAQATAARGVHSTLSLPVLADDAVVATVNLYGSRGDTFQGRHQAVANVFGAWAPGAVANADLSFSTRLEAAKAPGRITDRALIEKAVGVFMVRYGLAPQQARDRLLQSAAKAGITVTALAHVIIDELNRRP